MTAIATATDILMTHLGAVGWVVALVAGVAWFGHRQVRRARQAQRRRLEALQEEARRRQQQAERVHQAERGAERRRRLAEQHRQSERQREREYQQHG
jgi:uncharacterized protein HemX